MKKFIVAILILCSCACNADGTVWNIPQKSQEPVKLEITPIYPLSPHGVSSNKNPCNKECIGIMQYAMVEIARACIRSKHTEAEQLACINQLRRRL